MNEMYNMSIEMHYYSVIGILIVILLNAIMLAKAKEVSLYQRQMSLFTPIGSMALGGIIFTGIIMMAAKHLDFTLENIIMILFSFAILFLEVKRVKTLKYLDKKAENVLDIYKKMAYKLLVVEVILTLGISIWMWQ